MKAKRALLALLLGGLGASARRFSSPNMAHPMLSALKIDHAADHAGAGAGAGAGADSAVDRNKATIAAMVRRYFDVNPPKLNDIMAEANGKLDLAAAVHQLDGKLPDDVAALVHSAGLDAQIPGVPGIPLGPTQPPAAPFTEESMQKARGILNMMIYDAFLELDDVIFQAKEFQERNRGTYEQVTNDLSRLGSQLAALGEERVASNAAINDYDARRLVVEGNLATATQQFEATKLENNAELTLRKNDLAVFDFILNLTACKPGQALLQGAPQPRAKLCSTGDGLELKFDNPRLQAQIERLLTPSAKAALRSALGMASHAGLDLMQFAGNRSAQLQPAATAGTLQPAATVQPATTVQPMLPVAAVQPAVLVDQFTSTAPPVVPAAPTTSTVPPVPVTTAAVQSEPHPDGQWKKCVDGEENCGLLHDLMSLEWGRFRDEVDILTAEMEKNQKDFDNQKNNFNDQLTMLGDAKTKGMEELAQTVSSINADTAESEEKEEQKLDLSKEYTTMMGQFHQKITEILFTKICAVRRVRNGLLAHSVTSPPMNIVDCDVSDWAAKDGSCFDPEGHIITCDDSCPGEDPTKCGGKEVMKREAVVTNNTFGMQCPPLERLKRCGQKKCPIDCELSEWSGWSKCTKECEGGVQVKTRSIIDKAKNGGAGCDSVQEEQACHTGSCDRDCSLEDWTEWAPCSMACGTGMTTRNRHVLVPIRGQGVCPLPTHVDRLEEETCNTHDCVGDEICIASQDLIIMLDSSGSLKIDGFEALRQFAANLTKRYRTMYFGHPAVKIGVVLFGNGHLVATPVGDEIVTSVGAALPVQAITDDLTLVENKIMEQTWQRGFTNMAQGFALADKMLAEGGRPSAQSAVMVISDGKYSFKFQTQEKAQELKDKNVQIFIAAVADYEGEGFEDLKSWASQPWETNYELIPGLDALKHNNGLYVQKLIAKFCPKSMSPSGNLATEAVKEYMLIHEGGEPSDDCGTWIDEGRKPNIDECAQTAKDKGYAAFGYGIGPSEGSCYSENLKITERYWDEFSIKRSDPPCPNGFWWPNPFMNNYALNPRLAVPAVAPPAVPAAPTVAPR